MQTAVIEKITVLDISHVALLVNRRKSPNCCRCGSTVWGPRSSGRVAVVSHADLLASILDQRIEPSRIVT